jgi:hypothetical protein
VELVRELLGALPVVQAAEHVVAPRSRSTCRRRVHRPREDPQPELEAAANALEGSVKAVRVRADGAPQGSGVGVPAAEARR